MQFSWKNYFTPLRQQCYYCSSKELWKYCFGSLTQFNWWIYICNQIVKKGRPICNCTTTFDSQPRKGVVFKNTAGAQSNMPLTHSTAPGQLQLATPITWRPAAAVVNHSYDSAIITYLQIVGWLIFLLAVEAPCSYFSPPWDFPHCKEVIHTLVKTKATKAALNA